MTPLDPTAEAVEIRLPPPPADERTLVQSLRNGDEESFSSLIRRHHHPMLRLARVYVSSEAVAEEVVQEAWMGVIEGIDGFEARSSLKTWIFRILTNCARKRGAREGRSVPFSSVWNRDADPGGPAVPVDRFHDAGGTYPGGWRSFPVPWDDIPEDRLLSRETLARIEAAIAALPPGQREVITLRDVEGLSGPEVCSILSISGGNQRIRLHRARSTVRRALEAYLVQESA